MSAGWGMGALFKTFLWGYLVGGLTLLPLLAILAWFWGTALVDALQPGDTTAPNTTDTHTRTREKHHNESSSNPGLGIDDEILDKLKTKTHVPDVCAGYFAVCREYVPGGVNGKPPDRTTPAGAVVAVESPSVYQSMYRTLFDRNKTASPTIDAANAKNKKAARNVFYVVLRLGHLMLYDNEDQIEVRHVISLAHYKVDVHAGGEPIPEGELWIKRNCIRLVQELEGESLAEAKSFFLFSDNCSEKEDFYHAMLQAQEHHMGDSTAEPAPIPLKFDTPDLVRLVQQLHASEENLHTRWINALIGRVFLAMYKTSQIKDFIAAKINKKISRVPKPALVSSITLRKVDMGTLPPFITNPKLKELTVDGDLIVEADVSYKGNFRIEISAIVRIDLGARFKAREVTLVLATVLKKLEGHVLLRIKPPPSNRLWMTFETPPKIDLSLEPIVSSRQITYGPILRVMENRIREVVNETLVLPNWDDMPFTNTITQVIRGGIWHEEKESKDDDSLHNIKQDDTTLERAIVDADKLDETADSASSHMSIHSTVDSEDAGTAVSSSTDYKSTTARPRTLRSSSSAAPVKVDSATASAEIFHDRSTLTPTSVRSLPLTSPMKSPFRSDTGGTHATESSGSSTEDVSTASISGASTKSAPAPPTTFEQMHTRTRSKELSAQEIAAAAAAAAGATNMSTKKQTLGQNLGSATAAARHWLASKQSPQAARSGNTNSNNSATTTNRPPSSSSTTLPLPLDTTSTSNDPLPSPSPPNPDLPPRPQPPSSTPTSTTHTTPMGRGQPLPPPGTPLPLPPKPEPSTRKTWSIPPAAVTAASTFANLAKRKAVGTAPALGHKKSFEGLGFDSNAGGSSGAGGGGGGGGGAGNGGNAGGLLTPGIHTHTQPYSPLDMPIPIPESTHALAQRTPDPDTDSEDLFRRRSVSTSTHTTSEAQDSRRRKSSAASVKSVSNSGSSSAQQQQQQQQQAPPLPKRRTRGSVSGNQGHGHGHGRMASRDVHVYGQGEDLFVVEAPVGDDGDGYGREKGGR
ncbi:hypothetical protein NX059_005173 [Plenodomus lindquistii]|nr:hypothetical protein NX059_005173 [Plenodomus lindquistii]